MKENGALNAFQLWEAQIAWTTRGAGNELCQGRRVRGRLGFVTDILSLDLTLGGGGAGV